MTEENKAEKTESAGTEAADDTEAQKPAAEKPAAETPASAKPTTDMPAAQKPVAEKPAAGAVVKPAAAKPTPAKPAAAKADAAPVEEKPDPKKEAAQQKLEYFQKLITAKFGEAVLEETLLAKYQPTFVIKRENWREVAEFLRYDNDCLFDYPEAMAGTDYPAKDYIEVVLYIYSMTHANFITIKTRTPREKASLPSLTPIYKGVNWEEREIFDLLGVTFNGHPDLRRIMMPEDYEGHPLRKDFSVWKE